MKLIGKKKTKKPKVCGINKGRWASILHLYSADLAKGAGGFPRRGKRRV